MPFTGVRAAACVSSLAFQPDAPPYANSACNSDFGTPGMRAPLATGVAGVVHGPAPQVRNADRKDASVYV